jgi:hypothetical protein
MMAQKQETYIFRTEAREQIKAVRSGQVLKGRGQKGSLVGAQEAAAQSGGPLPDTMYEAARKGKYVKKA